MPPTPRDGWWEPYLDTSYRDLCDAAHAAAGWQRRTTEGATPQGAARFTTGHVFPSMLAAPILGGHDGHHRTPGHGPAPAPAPPIGRASCRERVEISVVAVSFKKKNEPNFARRVRNHSKLHS